MGGGIVFRSGDGIAHSSEFQVKPTLVPKGRGEGTYETRDNGARNILSFRKCCGHIVREAQNDPGRCA